MAIEPEKWLYDLYASTFMRIHTYQYWADLALWERFLNEHTPELKGLIELGTYRGGMSIFLLLQATQRRIQFYTFDKRRLPDLDTPAAKLIDLSSHFLKGNIFEEGKRDLLELIEQDEVHPLLLYCDNGNKPKEFAMFVPHLRTGDYVAIHDWGIEFHPQHIKPVKDLLEQVFWKECETLKSLTRWWRCL